MEAGCNEVGAEGLKPGYNEDICLYAKPAPDNRLKCVCKGHLCNRWYPKSGIMHPNTSYGYTSSNNQLGELIFIIQSLHRGVLSCPGTSRFDCRSLSWPWMGFCNSHVITIFTLFKAFWWVNDVIIANPNLRFTTLSDTPLMLLEFLRVEHHLIDCQWLSFSL